jgi:NAD(P)-dependent dehydrogenase (short-subunit alcohol dehydrogenase family)
VGRAFRTWNFRAHPFIPACERHHGRKAVSNAEALCRLRVDSSADSEVFLKCEATFNPTGTMMQTTQSTQSTQSAQLTQLAQVAQIAADPVDRTLEGISVLVTGGASGLGAALCRLLAGSGAKVVIGDLHLEPAEALARALREDGGHAHAIGFDVGNPGAAEYAVAETVERLGRLDVLINNAGTDMTLPIAELTPAAWLRVIDTNLNGPFLMAKFASEHMRRAGGGHIVNITSTAAKRAWPNAAAYHASKWGLLGLSHAMHAELRPHRIKVTAVIAGGMRTPFLLDRFPDIDPSMLQDPMNVARAIKSVLLLPDDSVVAEITVLPLQETSWP